MVKREQVFSPSSIPPEALCTIQHFEVDQHLACGYVSTARTLAKEYRAFGFWKVKGVAHD